MSTGSRLTYIVPTVGRSPHLQACLEALAAAGGGEILLAVASGADLSEVDTPSELRVLTVPDDAGFTGACNRALAAVDSDYVALVNDDALVGRDWNENLLAELERDPRVAAVQGTNVELADTNRIDGCGIAWNRRWQAVQLGRGAPVSSTASPCEVFGVSCTAALLRRAALEEVALEGSHYFDTGLGTYYEDVELACRLRSRGYSARCVPQAQTRHAGSASSSADRSWRWGQIYGNRLLVLARLWGSSFAPRLPRLLARDFLDLAGGCVRRQPDLVLGIVRGWGRAGRRLPSYAHRGAPSLPMADLLRFQEAESSGVADP